MIKKEQLAKIDKRNEHEAVYAEVEGLLSAPEEKKVQLGQRLTEAQLGKLALEIKKAEAEKAERERIRKQRKEIQERVWRDLLAAAKLFMDQIEDLCRGSFVFDEKNKAQRGGLVLLNRYAEKIAEFRAESPETYSSVIPPLLKILAKGILSLDRNIESVDIVEKINEIIDKHLGQYMFEDGMMVPELDGAAGNDVKLHPRGFAVREGDRILLNGWKILVEGKFDDWWPHEKGVVVKRGRQYWLNGKELLYEGEGEIISDGSHFIVKRRDIKAEKVDRKKTKGTREICDYIYDGNGVISNVKLMPWDWLGLGNNKYDLQAVEVFNRYGMIRMCHLNYRNIYEQKTKREWNVSQYQYIKGEGFFPKFSFTPEIADDVDLNDIKLVFWGRGQVLIGQRQKGNLWQWQLRSDHGDRELQSRFSSWKYSYNRDVSKYFPQNEEPRVMTHPVIGAVLIYKEAIFIRNRKVYEGKYQDVAMAKDGLMVKTEGGQWRIFKAPDPGIAKFDKERGVRQVFHKKVKEIPEWEVRTDVEPGKLFKVLDHEKWGKVYCYPKQLFLGEKRVFLGDYFYEHVQINKSGNVVIKKDDGNWVEFL